MFDKSLRSLRLYLKMRRLIQEKNQELRSKDEKIQELKRKIFVLRHQLNMGELKRKGILVHGARETRRAGP